MALKLLRHSTIAEQNAAYNVVHAKLQPWIAQLPIFVQGQAREKLESSEGVRAVVDIIDAALDAAEGVREASEAKP